MIDTNVVFAGVASLNEAPVAAAVPVFVTTCVYVMLLPAITGLGKAVLLTVNSPLAVVPTIVVTVAVLFARFGSFAKELTDAVSEITVPFAVPLLTFSTHENVADVEAAMFEVLQTALPGPAGVKHVHPAGAANDTNVVLAGTVATNVALSAALGPLFVTIWV